MDPLTVIITAAAMGAAAAAKDVAGSAVKAAYTGLKRLITDAYGHKGDVSTALAQLEAKPDSEGRKGTLKEELQAAGAGRDKKLLQAARALLAKADPDGTRQGIYTIIGDGNVIGSGNVVNVTTQ